jgi:hypothetical protein
LNNKIYNEKDDLIWEASDIEVTGGVGFFTRTCRTPSNSLLSFQPETYRRKGFVAGTIDGLAPASQCLLIHSPTLLLPCYPHSHLPRDLQKALEGIRRWNRGAFGDEH